MKFRRAAPALLAVALLLPGRPPVAEACCPAYPPGARVQIADQEVLISYDPVKKLEHFVRLAAFDAEKGGFGFLVPTPSQPTLAEAPAEVFERLRQEIAPRVVSETEFEVLPAALCLITHATMRGAKGAAVPEAMGLLGVRVLDTARVAGYDAAVLEASDADALTDWLAANGYDARPALREWARPYVEAGWKVTAFKYAEDEGQRGRVTAKAVRLSFPTDRPLFPYRVPTDQIAEPGRGNLLRIYYVGPERAEGALASGEQGRRPWGAQTKFAAALPGAADVLAGAVPAGEVAPGAWLTAFEDASWPGGTDDLFFAPAADRAEVIPIVKLTDTVTVPLPLDVLAVIGFGVWLLRRRGVKAA